MAILKRHSSWRYMAVRTLAFRLTGKPLAAASLCFALAACGDDDEIDAEIASLTEKCALNSDCDADLVCVFERCHKECEESGDCPYPARCVQSDRTRVFVCQFPEEAECSPKQTKDSCDSPLLCSVDGQCRGPCDDSQDCPDEQLCTPDGVCADEDEVDDDGVLRVAETDDVDAGATSEEGAETDATDANDTADSDPEGTDGVMGTDSSSAVTTDSDAVTTDSDAATTDSDAATTDSAAATTDSDAMTTDSTEVEGPMSMVDYFEPSDGLEEVDNNDRDNNIELPASASIWTHGTDEDWFYIDAPPEDRAYIITLDIAQDADARTNVQAMAAADFSVLDTVLLDQGASSSVYVTVGGGSRTLLNFSSFADFSGRVDFTYTMTPELDAHEPNDNIDEPASIDVDEEVSGQFIKAYISNTDKTADDWYAIELDEGVATFTFLAVPGNLRFNVSATNPSLVTESLGLTSTGALASWSFDVATSGTHYIRIYEFSSSVPSMYIGAIPEHLAETYSFVVTHETP